MAVVDGESHAQIAAGGWWGVYLLEHSSTNKDLAFRVLALCGIAALAQRRLR